MKTFGENHVIVINKKTNNWSGGKKKQVTSMSWHLSPRYGWVPCGVDGHTDGHVIAKISWIDRGYQILVRYGWSMRLVLRTPLLVVQYCVPAFLCYDFLNYQLRVSRERMPTIVREPLS